MSLILKEAIKHLIIILFLTFMGYKNESKTKNETETQTGMEMKSEIEIHKSVYEMWNNYIESNPEYKDEEIPESAFFHNNREDANRLAELTVNGKKNASSGLYSLHKQLKVINKKYYER